MDIGKGWDGQKAQWVGRLHRSDGKITVGVCAREKKARSKHMEAITSRLNREKFEVCGCKLVCVGALLPRVVSFVVGRRFPMLYGQEGSTESSGARVDFGFCVWPTAKRVD